MNFEKNRRFKKVKGLEINKNCNWNGSWQYCPNPSIQECRVDIRGHEGIYIFLPLLKWYKLVFIDNNS